MFSGSDTGEPVKSQEPELRPSLPSCPSCRWPSAPKGPVQARWVFPLVPLWCLWLTLLSTGNNPVGIVAPFYR